MHFFYIDETGCNGRDLSQKQQPIFVSGGIILRDEGWNKTHEEFKKIILEYFENQVPPNFELHTQDLLSPEGKNAFEGHTRDKRNGLANKILDLLATRKHHYCYCGIDKSKLNIYNVETVKDHDYFDLKVPYLIAYDYLLTTYEKYTKENLGNSARALVIIDEKDNLIKEIESITTYRRFEAPNSKKLKWVVEFTYPVDSKKNTMIQISDLLLFITRKYLEIEAGYKQDYSVEIKNTYREFYKKINDRIITIGRTVNQENSRNSKYYNDFMAEIIVFPTKKWKTRIYE